MDVHRSWTENTAQYTNGVTYLLDKIADFSKKVFFLPGDTDMEAIDSNSEKIVNLDKNYAIINDSKKIGVMGLGGAPKRSVRKPEHFSYLWDEGDSFVWDELSMKLKVNLEKLQLQDTDLNILVSHSPPHGIGDRSIPNSLREILDQDELPEKSDEEKRSSSTTNPKHLGSKLLKNFLRDYPIDIHFFGHVHKRGGTTDLVKGTRFFNAGHLAPTPRKLYGRKLLRVRLGEETKWKYQSVVNKKIGFDEYLETYL